MFKLVLNSFMVGVTLSATVPSLNEIESNEPLTILGPLAWFFGPSSNSTTSNSTFWSAEQFQGFLPSKIYNFFDETINDGQQVVYDLLDDLEEDIVRQTSDSLDGLSVWFSDLEGNLQSVRQSIMNIFENVKPLTAEQTAKATEELNNLKAKFDNFEKKVQDEVEKEKNLPFALRNQLIKFITAAREMLAVIGSEEETYWGMLRQLENEVYQVKLILADSSEELKEKVDALFVSLQKVDLTKYLEEDEEQKDKTPRKTD